MTSLRKCDEVFLCPKGFATFLQQGLLASNKGLPRRRAPRRCSRRPNLLCSFDPGIRVNKEKGGTIKMDAIRITWQTGEFDVKTPKKSAFGG